MSNIAATRRTSALKRKKYEGHASSQSGSSEAGCISVDGSLIYGPAIGRQANTIAHRSLSGRTVLPIKFANSIDSASVPSLASFFHRFILSMA